MKLQKSDIQEIAEDIIWDEVSDYVEDIEEFKKMISGIKYINQEAVETVEWCEVFESDEINVTGYKQTEEEIEIEFQMPFVLSAWKENEQLFRVTSCAHGKAIIEDDEVTEIKDVVYEDVEADSII